MTNLIEFIIDLFRFPSVATSFVADPEGTMQNAGLTNVTAAQLASVAASAVPAGVVLGGGDPVVGLQNAVSDYYSMSSPFSPQTGFVSQPTFAPNTDFASGNNVPIASGNDVPVLSPDQHAGANAQQGAFNLGFGDITLGGSHVQQGDGGVNIAGSNSGDIASGKGAVMGDGNTVNNGDIHAGSHSPVIIGTGNHAVDNSTTAGGNVIAGNSGPVISDVNTGGGNGGSASAGGGLIGGGHANAGSGGSGGNIVINDGNTTSTSNHVGGNQTTVGHDLGSGNTSVIDDSSHSVSNSSSVNTSLNSGNTANTSIGSGNTTHTSLNSGNTANTDVHADNSVHSTVTDQSVHQAGLNTYAPTDVHSTTDVSHTTIDPTHLH
ncbi:MAG: IniB N-terminal domain-containing protein [Mycobacterium sp.]|nr:IniB N-terminal domain-containing protein [Mycobacterium sp.]